MRRFSKPHSCLGWITNLSYASCHKPRRSRAAPVQNADASGCVEESDVTNGGVCAPMQEPNCGTDGFAFQNGQGAVLSSMSAAFSPIMIDGALVLPDVSVGMIEASAIRRPVMPWTRS